MTTPAIEEIACLFCECGAQRAGGLPPAFVRRWARQHRGHAQRVRFVGGKLEEQPGETAPIRDYAHMLPERTP